MGKLTRLWENQQHRGKINKVMGKSTILRENLKTGKINKTVGQLSQAQLWKNTCHDHQPTHK